MEIACGGFIIRPPKMTDLESYHKNLNDPLIGKNMRAFSYPMPKAKAKAMLREYISKNRRKDTDSEGFFIDIDGQCVGAIALSRIRKDHQAMIGYWLASEHRGKGMMTKAVRKMVAYGFKRYGLRRIYAHVATFNKPSSKVLERSGFMLEGVLKKHRYKDGKYSDDFLYAITR